MARILLHTLVFAPDGVSTSVLLSELMQDLSSQGHTVTILSTRPHYNQDKDAEARQPLTPHLGGLYSTSLHHGMSVIHVYIPKKGERVGGRMRDYLIFHFLSLIIGILIIGRQDVVIAPSPPLSIGIIGWMLAKIKGAKFIYNVRELYPDLIAQMGLLSRESRLYWLLSGMERFVYRRSWRVVVICEMFRRHVVGKGIVASKVIDIPDFVDTDFVRPLPKDNPLARQLGLLDKYVVLYAGNIGMTQSLDTILTAIERLRDLPQVHFLIVGDGVRRSYLEEKITTQNLDNVTLLPYQSRHLVPDIYATGDLGLVPLMAGTAKTTIPSKIYTILSSGRPVLVSVDSDSELVEIVASAQCGLSISPDDPNAMEQAIRTAYANREQFDEYGKNGRQYVEQHFSRRAVNQAYDDLMRQAGKA
jgi:putative colanic acid biosynthesis glycosyltransferase WcaI